MAFYLEAWALYAAGCLGLLFLCWRLLRNFGFALKLWVLALLTALLATPWYALPETPSSLAPAVIIMITELITEGSAERGLLPILCVFMALLLAGYAARWISQRMRRQSDADTEPQPTAGGDQG